MGAWGEKSLERWVLAVVKKNSWNVCFSIRSSASWSVMTSLCRRELRMGLARTRSSSFFFQAEGGIRGSWVTGVQTCALPISQIAIGAGTLLTADNVKQAVDAGAQFGVSPGLSEFVSRAAHENKLPLFPGVVTPTEIMHALELGWKHLKFFPAETFGGVNALKALIGPFGHTGVKFIPTGGITAATLPNYLAIPQVAAIGGSWMAERKLVADKAWDKITALTAEAITITTSAK